MSTPRDDHWTNTEAAAAEHERAWAPAVSRLDKLYGEDRPSRSEIAREER